MPIAIRRSLADSRQKNSIGEEEIAFLCPDDWTLTPQIFALQDWLATQGEQLEPGSYVADTRISGITEGATGGGATIGREVMARLVELGIDLWFSEYAES